MIRRKSIAHVRTLADQDDDKSYDRALHMLKEFRRRVLPHWTDHWSSIVAQAQSGIVLHLGAGRSPLSGAVTVDIVPETGPDVLCDLNEFPWPFAEDTFDAVVAISILEHLRDFLGTMAEIHRISKSGAVTSILVPHFSSASAFVDPSHQQLLSARSCDYFVLGTALESEYGHYVPYRFDLVVRYVHLQGGLRYLPGAEWIAGHYPAFWEDYLCQFLRGGGIFWQLRTVK